MSETPDSEPLEQVIQRLTTMFEAVSDPATKQDCATVTVETPPGEQTIEYGAFHDGDQLNVPTASDDHHYEVVMDRVEREPAAHGHGHVVYNVDDLDELAAAELVVEATAGWSEIEIVDANLRTIEEDVWLPGWWPESLKPSHMREAGT